VTSLQLDVERHETVCVALDRTTPLIVDVVRGMRREARPPGMTWTNRDVAAHLVASAAEAEKAALGLPSLFDGVGPNAAVDEKLVASTQEQDPRALADALEAGTRSFVAALRSRDGSTPVNSPRATVSVLGSLIALDHHLHGGQIAESSGSAWTGAPADMKQPLRTVLEYTFDPEAARGFHGSFELRLKGVAPVRYAVHDGEVTLDGIDRVDCVLSSDPRTFLLYGIGVISQTRAILTGRLRASGRKPWLARSLSRLFPAVPHGGVRGRS
jgi:putative sterol carrier protein